MGDLVAYSHNILFRWRNYISQLLNVHDIRQTYIHTAESLVPEPSAFNLELAVENLRSHKLPGIDQIPAELFKAGGRTIRHEIHKLIISIWNKEEFPEEWDESFILPFYKHGIKEIVVITEVFHFCQRRKILSKILLLNLIPYAEEIIGGHQCGSERNSPTTDHIFCIRQIP